MLAVVCILRGVSSGERFQKSKKKRKTNLKLFKCKNGDVELFQSAEIKSTRLLLLL